MATNLWLYYLNHASIVYNLYKLHIFFYNGSNEKFTYWDLWLSNLGGKGAISIMFQQMPFAENQKCHFTSQGIVGSSTNQGNEGIMYACKKC